MRSLLILLLSIMFISPALAGGDGLIKVKSAHDVKQTADRLESALKEKGMTVFIRIDHTKGLKRWVRAYAPPSSSFSVTRKWERL